MRSVLVMASVGIVLLLGEFCVKAQTAGATLGPIGWAPDLDLKALSDLPTRMKLPFSAHDQKYLNRDYPGDATKYDVPANCEEMLEFFEYNVNFKDGTPWELRTGMFGDLGSRCAVLRTMQHVKVPKRSFLKSVPWNPDVPSLLPAGIDWTNNSDAWDLAMEAQQRGETLRQRHPHSVWSMVHDSLKQDDEGDPPYAAYYRIIARGDFNGDGSEDWIMMVDGGLERSGRFASHVFLLTKTAAADKIQLVRRIF